MFPSKSQDRGIARIRACDEKIYSCGISTAGDGEIMMAQGDAKRHITATTIDSDGASFVQDKVKSHKLTDQITVRVEDVSRPLPYPEDTFDYVYARLVLHYLPIGDLVKALGGLDRILKPSGHWFFVLRSDPQGRTGLTEIGGGQTRFFHTPESIAQLVVNAGFTVDSVESYQEHLCDDFYRKQPSDHIDTVIELAGTLMSNS